jgi:signal transduction histidine kinase/CheY-like chemotaxis protein
LSAQASLDAPAAAVYVAVGDAPSRDEVERLGAARPERRSEAQRLQDAAFATALHSALPLAAMLAFAALGVLAFGALARDVPSVLGVAVSLAGALVAGLLRGPRRQPPRRGDARARWYALARGLTALALLAVAPWIGGAQVRPTAWPLAVLMVSAIAILAAGALAPLRWPAAAAAALPLSPAAAAWRADEPAIAAACIACGACACAAAFLQHRRWVAGARVILALQVQIDALGAARDAVLRADEEKTRFLAIASHDLRQPVHAIGLFAGTLEKRLQGTEHEPLVRNLNRAIDGLDRSFSVMLDISRLDAGSVEPRMQQFPLRDLFRRLHMHFAGQAEQKGLGLRFSPGGKSISSDPQLLERILGNLVQNAIKYTDRGGIVVVARSTSTHTHVEVWDTGIGIRAGDLPRVFDEFYQVGRTGRVRAQGLGMGLAIVKRLARLLGHELIVASRPGRGTMFRLRIALGGLPVIQEATAAADTVPMILQPRTVLVVDDEETIRDGLCMLLQEWGYDAVGADSIAEAEDALARLDAPPDLILSDLHLGEGPDGIAGIETLRRVCGGDIPAVLVTGDTSASEIRRATESGHAVLLKPVQPRKLYDALRALGL